MDRQGRRTAFTVQNLSALIFRPLVSTAKTSQAVIKTE
jgi:hypothetical protein